MNALLWKRQNKIMKIKDIVPNINLDCVKWAIVNDCLASHLVDSEEFVAAIEWFKNQAVDEEKFVELCSALLAHYTTKDGIVLDELGCKILKHQLELSGWGNFLAGPSPLCVSGKPKRDFLFSPCPTRYQVVRERSKNLYHNIHDFLTSAIYSPCCVTRISATWDNGGLMLKVVGEDPLRGLINRTHEEEIYWEERVPVESIQSDKCDFEYDFVLNEKQKGAPDFEFWEEWCHHSKVISFVISSIFESRGKIISERIGERRFILTDNITHVVESIFFGNRRPIPTIERCGLKVVDLLYDGIETMILDSSYLKELFGVKEWGSGGRLVLNIGENVTTSISNKSPLEYVSDLCFNRTLGVIRAEIDVKSDTFEIQLERFINGAGFNEKIVGYHEHPIQTLERTIFPQSSGFSKTTDGWEKKKHRGFF